MMKWIKIHFVVIVVVAAAAAADAAVENDNNCRPAANAWVYI